jgi:lambda repressor-like predicted transcriptional regulator
MPGMNRLPATKRVQILTLLCEGVSLRATSRVADVSINTVTKLLEDAGRVCAAFHDETVRGVKARRVQCDEIWSFAYHYFGTFERLPRKFKDLVESADRS